MKGILLKSSYGDTPISKDLSGSSGAVIVTEFGVGHGSVVNVTVPYVETWLPA